MHKPIKYAEKALTYVARGAWAVFDAANRINQKPSFTPKWSEKPLLKSYEKSKPPLGWPRTTDSLSTISPLPLFLAGHGTPRKLLRQASSGWRRSMKVMSVRICWISST